MLQIYERFRHMQEEKQNISPIKQRILSFAATLPLSKRDFYLKIGVSRGTLESKTGITEDVMAKFIASYPQVSIIWLVTGQGSMLRADEPSTNSVTPSTDAPAAFVKPDDSILYNMYKDLQAEKKEKESEIKELNAKMLAMSEEIGRLKAKLGEEPEGHPKGLGQETAKGAFTKPLSSRSSPDAPSANAPFDGQ